MEVFVLTYIQLKKWKWNIKIILAFVLLFLLCVTLTSEYVNFSREMDMPIHIFEPFILMFSYKYVLVFITLIFLLLYQDVPFIDDSTPYSLSRTNRMKWALSQNMYILVSTFMLMLFAFIVSIITGFSMAYVDNIWSETARFAAYGGAMNQSGHIPLKLIKNLTPYQSVAFIFLLFFLTTLLLNTTLFTLNLWKGKYFGVGAVAGVILIGYIVSVDPFLSEKFGWFSIVGHTDLTAHHLSNTGGTQPTVWQSSLLIITFILLLNMWAIKIAKRFNFFIGEKDK